MVPNADPDAAAELEASFKKQGIDIYNSESIARIEKKGDEVMVVTESGKKLRGEKLLVAAGRKYDFSELKLENAGIEYGKRGIIVNKHLQTSKKHIYAVGDCNEIRIFSRSSISQKR